MLTTLFVFSRIGCYNEMKSHLGSIVTQVANLLTDPVPRVRHAACKAVGQMSLDFQAQSEAEIPVSFEAQFHSIVIPALFACIKGSEGHPRVQVGEEGIEKREERKETMLCSKRMGKPFFPPPPTPFFFPLQSNALSALVHFCDNISKDIIEPYLDTMLTDIGGLLSSSYIIVQEEVISVLATLADAAENLFTRYYDAFIPHLKNIIAVC